MDFQKTQKIWKTSLSLIRPWVGQLGAALRELAEDKIKELTPAEKRAKEVMRRADPGPSTFSELHALLSPYPP